MIAAGGRDTGERWLQGVAYAVVRCAQCREAKRIEAGRNYGRALSRRQFRAGMCTECWLPEATQWEEAREAVAQLREEAANYIEWMEGMDRGRPDYEYEGHTYEEPMKPRVPELPDWSYTHWNAEKRIWE
jgi:hypothetical protein